MSLTRAEQLASRPSVRLLALVPTLIGTGAVVVDFVQFEYFGAFLLPVLGLLAYVGAGLMTAAIFCARSQRHSPGMPSS